MTFVTFLKTSKIVTFPSVWSGFDHFHSRTLCSKSTFYLKPVTKTELFKPPCNCKSQWNSAIHNMTTTQTCHFHETLRLCSEMHHLSRTTYHLYANHNSIAAQTDTRQIHEKSLFGALPNGSAIGLGFEQLRTVANGCEHENNDRRTQL